MPRSPMNCQNYPRRYWRVREIQRVFTGRRTTRRLQSGWRHRSLYSTAETLAYRLLETSRKNQKKLEKGKRQINGIITEDKKKMTRKRNAWKIPK